MPDIDTRSPELRDALSIAGELMKEAEEQSTCTVKHVPAARIVPYKGNLVPKVQISGISLGIFVGVNRPRHDCQTIGSSNCLAGRHYPNRAGGELASLVRRLLCVNKRCGEVQADRLVQNVTRGRAKGGILRTREGPCARCTDYYLYHPVGMLIFDRLNENTAVGDNPWEELLWNLTMLVTFTKMSVFQTSLSPQGRVEGLTLVSIRRPSDPERLWEDYNRRRQLYFPEHGPRPVSDSRARLRQLLNLYPTLKDRYSKPPAE